MKRHTADRREGGGRLAVGLAVSVTAVWGTVSWGQAGGGTGGLGGGYRGELIRLVDLYNGGVDGWGGFLAYAGPMTPKPSWSGWAQPLMQRDFTRPSWFWNWDNHVIGQSRAIYINAEAHRATGLPTSRFRETAQRAADFLIATSWDATYGGFFWGVQENGANPPTNTAAVWGPNPTDKDAYGAVHPVFALAHAYGVTGDVRHLQMAEQGWAHFKLKHADPGYPGAFRAGFNRDYTQPIPGGHGQRNLDYMCHAFEALLALVDVTDGATRAAYMAEARAVGDHIVQRMVRLDPASSTRAYIPWRYHAGWTEDPSGGTSPGHQMEYAYLLSRAVERGIGDASWLTAAEKLINHTLHYAWDATRGIVRDDWLATPGFTSDGYEATWWPNAEAARAFAHFATVRGRSDLLDEMLASLNVIATKFVDPIYGGWFASLNPWTLAPSDPSMTALKGHPWKAGYHESMLYVELTRLAAVVPEPVTAVAGLAALWVLSGRAARRPRLAA